MDALAELIDALRCLPGIGPKSAQRIAYQLLQNPQKRQKGVHIATCLMTAMQQVVHCQRCNNYTSDPLCQVCQKTSKDPSLLCVVEGPADLAAIEQTGAYAGYYYVLMGKLSPLDGIGPQQLALEGLQTLLAQGTIREVILAFSPTIEGQATIHYLQQLLQPYSVIITQPAHGLPSGGEFEFLDGHTIGSALRHRSLLVPA